MSRDRAMRDCLRILNRSSTKITSVGVNNSGWRHSKQALVGPTIDTLNYVLECLWSYCGG